MRAPLDECVSSVVGAGDPMELAAPDRGRVGVGGGRRSGRRGRGHTARGVIEEQMHSSPNPGEIGRGGDVLSEALCFAPQTPCARVHIGLTEQSRLVDRLVGVDLAARGDDMGDGPDADIGAGVSDAL